MATTKVAPKAARRQLKPGARPPAPPPLVKLDRGAPTLADVVIRWREGDETREMARRQRLAELLA